LGITPQMVDDTLYDAFGQRQVATSYTAWNFYRVVMEVTPEDQTSPDKLEKLYVRSSTGGLVPLSSIARFEVGSVPLAINHQRQSPAVPLSFTRGRGAALGDAVAAVHRVEREVGLPASVRGAFAGTAQAFGASLSSEPWLIVAALFAVYVVLGILYES